MSRLRACLLASLVFIAPWRAEAQEAPLNAVATVGMVGDVVWAVGGDCVEVTTLMGPGVDPHLYRASARDVGTLGDADIVFYSGYFLEGQLADVLERLASVRPTHAVSEESIPRDELITEDGPYGVDPHLWMDAALWSRLAPTIAEAIAAERPDCADGARAAAEAYVAELEALDGWVREAIATIPAEHRVLVTAHDAFGYYSRAYGIDIAGIQGISTQAEASVADIRATARRVAELGVPAIFVESTINPRTVQAVVDAAAQAGQSVRIGGELFSDAMGTAGTADGTYIGMIHANTVTIVDALGGTVPPLPEGLSGWATQWSIVDGEAAR
ncbi:metal ABC transporter solute-binding protein, Zn/Mn family [Aureimonas mangrovi]|uniref:metal ABC transporter solute-binding protein, Zn/Mn family n=1 Tax=Aureimonas mangrovi TaxID=2758041 RepID=UPI00163DD0CA|nr:zinc ABC transporter substrate-binding protein [Aureimonas mangrovi]